jgi:hypothetical protein
VNAPLLLIAAALAADPGAAENTQNTFYSAETLFTAAVRGQDADYLYDQEPPAGPAGPTFAAPPGQNFGGDPFIGPPPAMAGPLFDSSLSFILAGPQPYRFGWSSRYDVGFLPKEGVHGGGARGELGIFEFNSAWRWTTGVPAGFPSLLFSWTPEFNYRSWDGPSNPDLPPNVYRFASDIELATPPSNPLSFQIGFTPAFVSDLAASPNGDSFNWDARGVVFFHANPQLQVALGVAFLDRVDNIIIPYAGVVWNPNDYWELRLLFPKSRISYFLGNWWGASAWVYGGVEYNVEAYQIDPLGPDGQHERIQLRDYRALFGLRTEGGGITGFVEVGWVFAREVKFEHGTPGFDINTGFIGRLGLRF